MSKQRRSTRAWNRVRAVWQWVVIALLALAVAVAAFIVPGYKTADLHLDEASVYVSRRGPTTIGQLNHKIPSIVQGAVINEGVIDVYQEDSIVILRSQESNVIQRYDAATNTRSAPVQLPSAGQMVLGGGAIAVLAPLTGVVWFGRVDDMLGTDFNQAEPLLDAGPNAKVTVTRTGKLLVLSPRDNAILRPGKDADAAPVATKLPFPLSSEGDLELSAIGDKAIVLDRRSSQVWIEGERHPRLIDGALTAHLAPPTKGETRIGEHKVRAFVETAAGVLGITDNNSLYNLTLGIRQADPIVPVVARGCVYGAQGGQVGVACANGEPRIMDIPNLPPAPELRFRVNRDAVVLNDAKSGRNWLVDEDMRIVEDWDPVLAKENQSSKEVENDETERARIDRTKPNQKPVAKPDELKARAGRSTMLPVMDNDTDPDGDILNVISAPSINVGSLALVRGGTQLQYTAPADAAGQVGQFTYKIGDGRGEEASANVTLKVVSADQMVDNSAPVQRVNDPHFVKLLGRMQVRVLNDWRDPEGDDLFLVKAEMDGTDDEVIFTPDGTVTYQDVGKTPGAKTIKVTVSDGVATTEGKVTVVAQPDEGPPTANGDYYQTNVGTDLLITPTSNDLPSSAVLTFVGKAIPAGPSVKPNYTDGTVHFQASAPGTYYVEYTITTGPNATGVIRIDVRDTAAGNSPPVPVRDVALLPAGDGSVLVDPLLNDEDPDGDVLVLQYLSADPSLRIEQTEKHLVTIAANTALTAPVTLTYQVSDGRNTATGTLVVVPAQAGADMTPVAVADEVMVRAGDTATVNVVANDYSPAGLKLTVDRALSGDAASQAWVDRDRVRFQAPNIPGTFNVVYQVRDKHDRIASNYVRFNVTSADADNAPPLPKSVVGRVIAGQKVRIPIPLDGIDPNGDSVRLLGLASGPAWGRITGMGERWLEYEAYPSSTGTDTFSYSVTDARGLVGTATMQVGIVPRADRNNQAQAVDDVIAARPGRTIRIPLLANDSDPDGQPIHLLADSVSLQFGDKPIEGRIVEDRDLEITLPATEGTIIGSYTISDPTGGKGQGTIRVDVAEDAPLLPPVARDDLVAADQVIGRNEVDIAALVNDYDPDGDREKLTLSIPQYPCAAGSCASAPAPADQLGVPADDRTAHAYVGENMKLVRYDVTDSDSQTASGVLIIPGYADSVPSLKPDIVETEVTAGTTFDFDVTNFVNGPRGTKVMLTSDRYIWASHGKATSAQTATVRYTAEENYEGPASIVFQVTDGTSPADPNGRKAVLTIPIKVVPAKKTDTTGGKEEGTIGLPPVVEPLTLSIAAGEARTSLDLRSGAHDPENDPLRFEKPQGALPEGVTVEFDNNHTLTGQASVDTRPGTQTRLTSVVDDGHGGKATLVIDVIVTPSSKPRAAVTDDREDKAVQGREVFINVLENDINPFPSPPLKIEAAVLESPAGALSSGPTIEGGSLRFTPASNFHGMLTIRYTVSDATKQEARWVDGHVYVNVRGVPSAPGTPIPGDTSDTNRKYQISWRASDANGAEVTSYLVTATDQNGQTVQQSCPTSTCTINGLTNGNHYTFSVVAVNEVGKSDPSPVSVPMTPDTKPGIPAAPIGTSGDQLVTLNWTPPANEGSAIAKYVITVMGDPTRGSFQVEAPGTATSKVIDGLANKASYTFKINAVNQSNMASGDSAASAAVIPAGKPFQPVIGRLRDGASPTGGTGLLEFTIPDDNGSPILSYVVTVTNADTGITVGTQTYDASAVTATGNAGKLLITNVPNASISVNIAAVNAVGQGPNSPTASQPAQIYGKPAVPTGVVAWAGNGVAHLEFAPIATDGAPVSSLMVRYGNVEVPLAGVTSPQVVAGLKNGTSYTFQLMACSGQKCSDYSAATGSVVPFGPPEQMPTIVARAASQSKRGDAYSFAFSVKAEGVVNGMVNGATFTRLEMRTSDGWAFAEDDPTAGPMSPMSLTHTGTIYATTVAYGIGQDGKRVEVRSGEQKLPLADPLVLNGSKITARFFDTGGRATASSCEVWEPRGTEAVGTSSVALDPAGDGTGTVAWKDGFDPAGKTLYAKCSNPNFGGFIYSN